jgi:hypothetical protein
VIFRVLDLEGVEIDGRGAAVSTDADMFFTANPDGVLHVHDQIVRRQISAGGEVRHEKDANVSSLGGNQAHCFVGGVAHVIRQSAATGVTDCDRSGRRASRIETNLL